MCITGGESGYLLPNTPIFPAVILQIGLLLAPVGIFASCAIKAVSFTGPIRFTSIGIALVSLAWLAALFLWYIFSGDGCGGLKLAGSDISVLLVGYPAILAIWFMGQLYFYKQKAQTRLDLYAFFGILASISAIFAMLYLAVQNI